MAFKTSHSSSADFLVAAYHVSKFFGVQLLGKGGGDTVEELAIVGETPNVAARLQEAAEPNSVAISDITANLVHGFFLSESMGTHELKGISQPMELFRVMEESGAQTRFDVAASSQLTPLVGRDQEIGLLLDRWEQVKEGLGQVVLLSGEAGIGKSRLIDALTERLAKEPHTYRQLRCSAYHQNSALHPILEYLQSWLEFGLEDSAEIRLSKLEGALANVDFPLAEAVPLLAGLLSVPLDNRFPALDMSPEGQRERAFELLVALLLDSVEEQPVFIVVEDMHWADPSTMAMLGFLLDQAPTIQVLALLSFRPEFSPPWASRAYVTPILLNRLTRRLATSMLDRLTGGKTLPEEIITQITSKSDGVPLFVEELIHMVLESELLKEVGDHYELTGPLPPLAIPSTLQDSLTARLDRLAEVREVAQLGAVLGREFSYDLMQAVSPLDEETLRTHLQQLVSAEFLNQRGLSGASTYIFRHALIQDAAYDSLLRSRRHQYHQQVAAVLEERFPDTVKSEPELLAHHYEEAGLISQAVSYWQRAGERALETYAWDEALVHFQRGLISSGVDLQGHLPAPNDETAALLFGLGQAQTATMQQHQMDVPVASFKRSFRHYAETADISQALTIAQFPFNSSPGRHTGFLEIILEALAMVVPDSIEAGRLHSRYGQALGTEAGQYEQANDSFNRALNIAQREGDAELEMWTLSYSSRAHLNQLQFRESVDKGRRAIEIAQQSKDLRAEVVTHRWVSSACCISGNTAGALLHSIEILPAAERLGDRFYLALSLGASENVLGLQGDWVRAREFSDRGMELSPQEARFFLYRALIEAELGEYADSESYLERLFNLMHSSLPGPTYEYAIPALAIPLAARISGDTKGFSAAREAAAVASSGPAAEMTTQVIRSGLALIAVQEKDAVDAGRLYPLLKPAFGTAVFAAISGDRLLGLLAQTIGNLNPAAEHFEDGLAFCRKADYRPELAWTLCDYADTLLERNIGDDRAKAITLLEESLAISTELGMRPLMERVQSRREIPEA